MSNPVYRSVIAEQSAWKAADLVGDESWRFAFDAQDLAEIDQAYRAIAASGRKWGEFGKADFHIPRVARKLENVSAAVREGRGFALLKGFPVDRYSLDEIKTIYWGFGVYLGTVISNNAAGEFVSPVVDQGLQPHDPNRRNNTTNQLLDPHTDLADIVILLCIEKAKEGGLSSVASTTAIHNEILANHPEYLDVLYTGFFRDFRGDGYTGDPNEVTPVPIPVFEYHNNQVSCAFARKIILDAAAKAGIELTPLQRDAIDYVHDLALRDDMRFDMMLEPGDIQVLNNYSILHSRSNYVDHDDGRKRYLLRMWINLLADARLSPEFAAIVRRGIPAKSADGGSPPA